MTRATYNTDNTLTELPGMEPPNKLLYSEREILQYHSDVVQYGRHLSTLRTLVCSPECRGLWKPGQVLEEDVDYEVKGAGEWKWASQLKGNVFAAPVPPPPASAEDEAARMYPYVDISNSKELTDLQRSAHITCAGMYEDTIDKLKAENAQLRQQLQDIKDEHDFRNKPLM